MARDLIKPQSEAMIPVLSLVFHNAKGQDRVFLITKDKVLIAAAVSLILPLWLWAAFLHLRPDPIAPLTKDTQISSHPTVMTDEDDRAKNVATETRRDNPSGQLEPKASTKLNIASGFLVKMLSRSEGSTGCDLTVEMIRAYKNNATEGRVWAEATFEDASGREIRALSHPIEFDKEGIATNSQKALYFNIQYYATKSFHFEIENAQAAKLVDLKLFIKTVTDPSEQAISIKSQLERSPR